ncbi:MAG TPA: BrnA antitoxin family protein [Bordetella sp.]
MKKSADNIVKLTLDPKNPPPLTAAERAELKAVMARPDSAIDYSDAPELGDAFWAAADKAVHAKKQITLRIDSDVVDFFKHTGKRYQTRINAVLRAYVDAHKKAHS